jgi:sulfate adenylyltransferase large subunit
MVLLAGAEAPHAAHRPYPASELLRFVTAGSVDDGKSTLIGRLLHDSKGIFEDQLAAIELASRRRGKEAVDLALLTDGLRAEREQGITIDVAYRYFATPRRKFVIADTPGHVQYTRNMVTGCTTADLAVVLVDARRGVVEQTRRHTIIAALLGVPHLVGAVNKMDLVGWDADVFEAIRGELASFADRLGVPETTAIPVSALLGDNVVDRSTAMPWYDGPALLEHLESVELESAHDLANVRFPVQWVIRASTADDPDYRAYAGRVDGGILRPGDRVVALPSGIETRIRSIDTYDGPIEEAYPPLSVAIRLDDDVDLGRGGMLVGLDDVPEPRSELVALVCWLGDAPLAIGGRYRLQHTSRTVRAIATDVVDRIDVDTLERDASAPTLGPNDIGRVRLRLAEPIHADSYRVNRSTGSAVLIDEATNTTVGAVLITADREGRL